MLSSRFVRLSATLLLIGAVCPVMALDYSTNNGAKRAAGVELAEPDPTNYTDLRISYLFISNSSKAGGSENGTSGKHEWDGASRISVMTFGPVCSIIPINCFTPSRVQPKAKPPAVITWGEDQGWGMMGGLEITRTSMSVDAQTTAPVHPSVKYTNTGINWHILGLGTEFACKGGWRAHGEINPFIGLGYTSVDWSNSTVNVPGGGTLSDTTSGISFEVGARAGLFVTSPAGIQLGGEIRYISNSSSLANKDYLTNVTTDISGLAFGLTAGYRF